MELVIVRERDLRALIVGGSDTKLKAAMDAGISVIVIDKPKAKLDGAVVFSTVEGVLSYMEEHYGFHQKP